MTINRVKVCALCTTEFTTSQFKAKYCPVCRTKATQSNQVDRRHKLAEKRILSLPQSDEWLWIARECKRAGTVEILQDVNLVTLFAIYKARFKTYGYNPETKTSKFHLCHIQPVAGGNSVGLLHHLNIFIGNGLPNQVNGNNSYPGKGLCIQTDKLKKKWLIADSNSDRVILDKIAKYLGPVLIDYAKEHPIRKSQRFSLARWVYQNDVSNALPLSKLEKLSMRELRAIKAKVKDEEVYQMDFTAKRSVLVALEECQRLSEQLPDGQHKSDIAFMVPVLQATGAWLRYTADGEGLSTLLEKPYGVKWEPLKLREGMDASALRDFVSFQAFGALQGAPVNRKMIRATLSRYLAVTALSPDYSGSNSSIQKYHAEEYSRFIAQVPIIKSAIISLGLPNKVMLSEELFKAEEAAREEEIYASFGHEQCEGPLDYSTIHYEVEEDYIPNPNLKAFKDEVFCGF